MGEKFPGIKVENIKPQVDRFVFPGARSHHSRVWSPSQFGLRHWPPLLCDVLLVHEPGAWPARLAEELEGKQRLQEPCLPLAQGLGRKGRQAAPTCTWRTTHSAQQGAGRLHRCEGGGSIQT